MPRSAELLGEASWLNAERARAWMRVLAILSILLSMGYLATLRDGLDLLGRLVGTDFVSFWTAGRLALHGHAADIYRPELHAAAERALFPHAAPGYTAFFYPPTFLLLCVPLAVLPYTVALSTWLLAGFALFYGSLRRLLPQRWAILPILAFPGVLVNAGHGQNGFISASCFGWCMVLSRRRPFLAGLSLGLLAFKPHLLLLAPLLVGISGGWRILAGATTSAVTLVSVSWLVFGSDVWQGFARNSALARQTLEQGLVQPWKMQSVFAAARLLHAGIGTAALLQAVIATAVFVLTAWHIRRQPDVAAGIALLATATALCTPFLLDYDLMILAAPIAWVAAAAQHDGWRDWEKLVLLASYALPLMARPIAMTTGVPLAPLVIGGLLLLVVRRASQPLIPSWHNIHYTANGDA